MMILPVIHHLDKETSLEQALLAKRCGADGVFLISHDGRDDEILDVANQIKILIESLLVGVNLLSSSPMGACQKAKENGLDMVWADDMGVRSDGIAPLAFGLAEFAKNNPHIKLFASVAFKYQPEDVRPSLAAIKAKQLGFIPTTSGSSTGSAPDISKITTMSFATKGLLAVASGMNPENIDFYSPFLSHVLVATGVSSDEYHFDEEKLTTFIEKAAQQK